MKLEEYNLLSKEEQHNCWLHAVPVATYQGTYTVKVLYQLHAFYIESTYLITAPHESYSIAFSDTAMLSPYLNKIDIRVIINALRI